MILYHYYDKRSGPFRSLTALSTEKASKMLEKINDERPDGFCAKRENDYLEKRRNCESIVRAEFLKKGGIAELLSPYYMIVGHSPWLASWYEQCEYIKIPIEEFDTRTISFTYGDSMPTFSPKVSYGKEYRMKVYTYGEILHIIDRYGLPQDWNNDGAHGPERYIEAHIWCNDTINKYLNKR